MRLISAVVPRLDVLDVPREAERQLGLATDPRQRAILTNFRRHAMLEVSGRRPEIFDPADRAPSRLPHRRRRRHRRLRRP